MFNISKPEWYIIIIVVLGGLSTYIGVSAHIDMLQFDQISATNNKNHELELHIAVLNAKVDFLSDLMKELRNQHLSGDNTNLSLPLLQTI